MAQRFGRVALAALLLLSACATMPQASGRRGELSSLSVGQLLEVASVLEHSGEHVRAQQYLQEALRAGAPTPRVMPRLLRLYAKDGQYRLATDQAEHYLRAHPRDHGVRRFLAALYTGLELQTKAVEQYARVLAAQPRDAQAHFALASVLHDAGSEPLRADQHFRAYLALEPDGAHAEEARSLLLTELP
jgi:tetratricopeptide (TPR) repeat protein